MAGKGTISITFRLNGDGKGFKALANDAEGLKRVMESTLQQSEGLKKSLINWSAAVTGIQSASNAISQLNSVLQAVTADSASFASEMRAANTMAGKDAAGFEALKGQVAELAKTVPVARDELAKGLYQVISNGVPEGNWIEFLEKSAKASVGGIADLGQAVNVTSTLIKNYGLEWSAAGEIQDKIQLTAKNGVTSFEQLAAALPRVAGNAATLGVSVDDLMASFATLTGVSGNTAEVSTQLAAIFTALVKPSSEATKMAAEMGIQFDAAAIKAAGGFQNFIEKLDASVKSFSAKKGLLEQEVYGKLFGSAESLRALVPLVGELRSKFGANVSAMSDSAGTMDAAFSTMAESGSAVSQMLKNQWGAVTDVVASITASARPYIDFAANVGMAASSVAILTLSVKQLHLSQRLAAVSSRTFAAVMRALGFEGKTASAAMASFRASVANVGRTATVSKIALNGLKLAIKGVMIATGVGLAITALTSAIEALMGASDKAKDAVDGLSDAEEKAEAAHREEAELLAKTKAELTKNISELKNFKGSKEEERRVVEKLNGTYGETMGYFSSVSAWYKALTANSETYTRQIVLEAKARRLANQAAEAELDAHNLRYDEEGNLRTYSKRREKKVQQVYTDTDLDGALFDVSGIRGGAPAPRYEEVEVVGSSEQEKAQAEYDKKTRAAKNYKDQLEEVNNQLSEIAYKETGSS